MSDIKGRTGPDRFADPSIRMRRRGACQPVARVLNQGAHKERKKFRMAGGQGFGKWVQAGSLPSLPIKVTLFTDDMLDLPDSDFHHPDLRATAP
jgi:hypothetical protein